jgi:hypothetical protein
MRNIFERNFPDSAVGFARPQLGTPQQYGLDVHHQVHLRRMFSGVFGVVLPLD